MYVTALCCHCICHWCHCTSAWYSVFTPSSRSYFSNAVLHDTLLCERDDISCPGALFPQLRSGSWEGFAVWNQFENHSFRWRMDANQKEPLACWWHLFIRSRFSYSFAVCNKILHFLVINILQLIWRRERKETHLSTIMLCSRLSHSFFPALWFSVKGLTSEHSLILSGNVVTAYKTCLSPYFLLSNWTSLVLCKNTKEFQPVVGFSGLGGLHSN